MGKFYTSLAICIVLALFAFLWGCNSNNATKPVTEFAPLDTDTSESDIREQKPKFLDFTSVSAHLLNTRDNNYIRVVTNSGQPQKVWMVYYDHKNKAWQTLTWTGTGLNNKIIADTTFNTKFGVVENPTGPIDDPTFYMAYSKDTGRTWQNHPIAKAVLYCQKDTARILVSDVDKTTGKPAIVVILQPLALPLSSTSKTLDGWDDSYLCPLLRDMKMKK